MTQQGVRLLSGEFLDPRETKVSKVVLIVVVGLTTPRAGELSGFNRDKRNSVALCFRSVYFVAQDDATSAVLVFALDTEILLLGHSSRLGKARTYRRVRLKASTSSLNAENNFKLSYLWIKPSYR